MSKKERRKTKIVCIHCGKVAIRNYSLAKFCNNACKQANLRKRKKEIKKSTRKQQDATILQKEFSIYNHLNQLANEAIAGKKKNEALDSLVRVERKLDNVAASVRTGKTIRKKQIVLREGDFVEVDSQEWHEQNRASTERVKRFLKQKKVKDNGNIK